MVQDAWDEQVTTYEDYPWDCCNVCGADCTADPGGHAYQHAIKGEGGGHHTEYDSRPVTKTVHHDAVYGTRWVQDTAAYDETVVDGMFVPVEQRNKNVPNFGTQGKITKKCGSFFVPQFKGKEEKCK